MMVLPWYSWFKIAVFALLACNASAFLLSGTPSEALDAAAWLTLLALFELETAHEDRLQGRHALAVTHASRVAAAAAVVIAAAGYVFEGEWLDAANSWLWIAVVVLLEFEVRYPGAVKRRRVSFAAVAATLYAGLAALVLAWAWRSEWFDAYDALLWLIAFVTIELNVLRLAPGGDLRAGAETAKSA
ncbi:MAG: hypothetical protein A3G24_25035 [Betaproteobacteria bacterium RIFCSPLOWO2_12_FULL_62_13]|nr:MAG: hypothetical protein A3G24_25035 [Betaproteobacteria bacterium RIFCSPLOWO2_12_FULL_62_13]